MRLKQTRLVWLGLLVMLVAGFGLAACEDEPTEEPPAIPPSITLKPPFISETPRFTATLTPSQTFTPSDTPAATDTPTSEPPTETPTPTPTLAVQGVITSLNNLNVREGPGTEFDAVIRVVPGTEVDIYESDTNTVGEVWYRIGFEDEERGMVEGWVIANWVDDGDAEIPTAGPTPTPSPSPLATSPQTETTEPDDTTVTPSAPPNGGVITATLPPEEEDGTPAGTATASATPLVTAATIDVSTFEPFETAVPSGTVTPPGTLEPSRRLSDVNVLAYCQTFRIVPPRPRENQTVSIYWSWFVTRPELMQQHLDNAQYIVLLDGKLLADWQDFQTEMFRDPANNSNWTVYWYVPVGQLEPGEHTVEFRVTWDEPITDGLAQFGPGTNNPEDTGECTFTVIEAN